MTEQAPKKGGNKRTKMLLGILALVIIAAAGYFFLFSSPSAPEQSGETLKPPIIPDIDFSVFDSEAFKRFKVWGSIPVVVPETGKENPFSQ